MKKVVLFILLIFLVGCAVQEPVVEQVPEPEPAAEPVVIDLEEPITEAEEPEVLEIPDETVELGVKGKLKLTDEMYEYGELTYEYNDETFGVGGVDSYKYDGPAPIISADDSFSMKVYEFDDNVDIEFNYDSDYEATGLLSEGDVYVNKDGIKLTVEKILTNKFIYTIEKVSSDLHTELCPDCIRFKTGFGDDGVKFIDAFGTTKYIFKGEEYIFRLAELNQETDEVRIRVNNEVLPVLLPGQEYLLENGEAIKFLFSAAHDPPDKDPYGYAAFGFVETHILPDRAYCPDCNTFMYLTGEDTIRVGQVEKPISVDAGYVIFDGKRVKLVEGEPVFVTDDLSVQLLEINGPQYRLGLLLDDVKPFVSCEETSDNGNIFSKRGEILFKTGPDTYDREDTCLDKRTLVEYSCVGAVGREYDPEDEDEKGEGGTATMTYAKCDCYNGACKNNPTCEGLDC